MAADAAGHSHTTEELYREAWRASPPPRGVRDSSREAAAGELLSVRSAARSSRRTCPVLLPWSESEPWTSDRRDVASGGALTEVRGNHGAGVVDCGSPVTHMVYGITMRAATVRWWLRPGRWCRSGFGRGVVERQGPARGKWHDGWSGVCDRWDWEQAASRRRLCGGVARRFRQSRPCPSVLPASQCLLRAVTRRGVRPEPARGARDGELKGAYADGSSEVEDVAGLPCGDRIGRWQVGVGADPEGSYAPGERGGWSGAHDRRI